MLNTTSSLSSSTSSSSVHYSTASTPPYHLKTGSSQDYPPLPSNLDTSSRATSSSPVLNNNQCSLPPIPVMMRHPYLVASVKQFRSEAQTEQLQQHIVSESFIPMAPNLIKPPRKRRRPPFSYSSLIAQAILESEHERMTLRDIYSWITARYPALYNAEDTGWQNTIRHNLSLNRCFKKIPKSDTNGQHRGKGGYWTIDPTYMEKFKNGSFIKGSSSSLRRKTSVGMPTSNTASSNDTMTTPTTATATATATATPPPPPATTASSSSPSSSSYSALSPTPCLPDTPMLRLAPNSTNDNSHGHPYYKHQFPSSIHPSYNMNHSAYHHSTNNNMMHYNSSYPVTIPPPRSTSSTPTTMTTTTTATTNTTAAAYFSHQPHEPSCQVMQIHNLLN